MQEEVIQKTIALVIKTAKLDANVLKAAMRMYLNHQKQKAQKTHGKTSVKKLVGDGVGVSSIEVTDGNIKSFERVAKKYNVDFAIKCLWRVSPGQDASAKMMAVLEGLNDLFKNPLPSLHPKDLLIGAGCGIALYFIVYFKAKNAKKFRHGMEYGSAR